MRDIYYCGYKDNYYMCGKIKIIRRKYVYERRSSFCKKRNIQYIIWSKEKDIIYNKNCTNNGLQL